MKPAGASRPARRGAYRRGRRAEWVAALWLRLKGYRILARGYRCPAGEIDLIARRGGLLAFVEVKQRRDLDAAATAITRRQRQRVARAAAAFLQGHPQLAALNLRFDAVLLSGWLAGDLSADQHGTGGPAWLRHEKDAWRSDTGLPY